MVKTSKKHGNARSRPSGWARYAAKHAALREFAGNAVQRYEVAEARLKECKGMELLAEALCKLAQLIEQQQRPRNISRPGLPPIVCARPGDWPRGALRTTTLPQGVDGEAVEL